MANKTLKRHVIVHGRQGHNIVSVVGVWAWKLWRGSRQSAVDEVHMGRCDQQGYPWIEAIAADNEADDAGT